MITTAHRDDAAPLFRFRQGKHFVKGATDFDGAGPLKHFQLQINIGAEPMTEGVVVNQWSAFNKRSDARPRELNAREADYLRRSDIDTHSIYNRLVHVHFLPPS